MSKMVNMDFKYQYILLFLLMISYCVQVQGYIKCERYGGMVLLSEDTPLNTEIFNPNCTDTQGGVLTFTRTKGIPNNPSRNKFKFSGATGIVSVKGILNADFLHKFHIYFRVTSNSGLSPEDNIELNIKVLNENDNAPVIKDLPATFDLLESTNAGTLINSCSANDKDKDEVKFYLLTAPGSDKFSLDENTCDLYLSSPLDREVSASYTLTLKAMDQQLPFRNSTKAFTVTIRDENDNSPICDQHYKVIRLAENWNLATPIGSLTCTDVDAEPPNNQIQYVLSGTNDAEISSTFSVNSVSGDVMLLTALDYETKRSYKITIDVTDKGATARTSTVILEIVVEDVDDNAPDWIQPIITISVLETIPLGHILLYLNATDKDQANTDASAVMYELEPPVDPDWFVVDLNTGAVIVNSVLNSTRASSVALPVIAYSDKSHSVSSATVNIEIVDVNNVAPQFLEVIYQANVSESDTAGTPILTVSASDPEEGINGEVEYYINSTLFQVDSLSGEVSLSDTPDYETETLHSILVEARDKGDPTQTGSVYLMVNILPINEDPPTISVPTSSLSIPEDTEPGTILMNITVTDADRGLDGEVELSVQNASQPFTVDINIPALRVLNPLDREKQTSWEVVLLAIDRSETESKSTSTTVTIQLTDVNDNNPICEPLANTIVKLPHVINSEIGQIECTDADEGVNAEFTYLKLSGDPKNEFNVDSATGKITLLKEPTAVDYTLTIEVKDKGSPQLSVKLAYNIKADLKFEFVTLPDTKTISEDKAPPTEIYDIDTCCVFGSVKFEILTGNEDGHVMLDPSSGKIILRQRFDFESETNYRYRVRATAVETGIFRDSHLDVSITDSNDNSPQLPMQFRYLNIGEDFSVNTSILDLSAVDLDSGVNQEIVYSVTGGSQFYVDSNGILQLSSPLDAETQSQYTLTVTATDKGSPALSDVATLIVYVSNVNEFPPQILDINNGSVHTNMSEDAALGAKVFTIKVSDQDINSAFSYNITQGNEDKSFIIDSETGEIYLAKFLDREITSKYDLTIEVEETSTNEKVSAVVSIDVLDVNDNDPKFSQDVYQLEVTHEDPANTLVASFIITDDDIGTNKDIDTIAITEGDPLSHFKIMGTDLRTNVPMDYYSKNFYSLTVEVSDKGAPARSSTARVIIRVKPNFKSPRFLSTSYSQTVREDILSSENVFDMDATADGSKEGNTGTLIYSILSGNDDRDFVISEKTGVIQITSALDFERKEQYTLNIQAKSTEDSLLTATAEIVITVDNINDNSPIFTQIVYTFTVDEGSPSNFVVGVVQATDADKPPHNSVSYSFNGGSSTFIVDNAGQVKVNGTLHYLTQTTYTFPVFATDGTLTDEALVIISINDINDNSPTFTPASMEINVVESMGIGEAFYTVKAEDLDTGTNGDLEYTILSGDKSLLDLDGTTGTLTVKASLDREVLEQIALVIQAKDKATTNPKSGTLSLTVNIADVNDEDPVFSTTIQEATVNRKDSPGTIVLAVLATDRDKGINAEITYEISSGNTDGMFIIDLTSGDLKLASDPTDAQNEYNLIIKASDKGIPARTGTMQAKIQVIPLKNVGSTDQSIDIQEEQPNGILVGTVTPTHTVTPAVNYQIIGGNFKDSFTIDADSGQIRSSRKLDREEYSTYVLTVQINDDPGISYTKSIAVNVLDINDNSPVLTIPDTTINVVENTPINQNIAEFTVYDIDIGDNGIVDLSISDSPVSARNFFKTNGKYLQIKQILDFETTTAINFKVIARDRGTPQRTSEIQISVNVMNVSDEIVYTEEGKAPSVYISRETSYNSADGERATILYAKDFGFNKTDDLATFTTVNTDGLFAVAPTGEVTVQKKGLLRPETKYYEWVVASLTSANASQKDILGLLRIDTFDPNKHVVSVESSSDVASLESYRDELELQMKQYFAATDTPKIWKIIGPNTTNRRRLLAAASQTLVYVVEGSSGQQISDLDTSKQFKNFEVILSALRLNPNEDTPKPSLSTINYPVIAVNAYSEPVDVEEETPFTSSMEGYITFAMLGLLLIIILIIIIIYCVYKKKKQNRESLNESCDSTEELMPPEPPKEKRKIEITKPVGIGVGKLKKEPPKPIIDDTQPSKRTKKTSLGPNDIDASKKRSASVSPTRLVPSITPVQSTASASDINLLKEDSSFKGRTSRSTERRVLPIPQKSLGKKVSTIDPASGKESGAGSTDDKPVIPKRNNGPIVNRGKEYDGVGFDKEKNQRYAYNTRTGSTLWMEKEKGLGAAGPKAAKKKAAPKLTVVSEAAPKEVLNLTLNRSIGVISSDA